MLKIFIRIFAFVIYTTLNLNTLYANSSEDVNFTKDEIEWIKKHRVVDFTGDPNWLPFEAFNENGEYIGIVSDYLKNIENISGLKFNPIQSKSWSESIDIAINNRVSVISGDSPDTILNREFDYIQPYLINPIAIAMTSHQEFINSLYGLKDKRIAVIKDYGYTAEIFELYPDIEFIKVENIDEGLEQLSNGYIDIFLGSLALLNYSISTKGLDNLHIVGQLPIEMRVTLFVSKKEPTLKSIIEKSLQTIDNEMKYNILQKWTLVHKHSDNNYILLIIIVGLLILIFAIFQWGMRLKTEIQRREKAEYYTKVRTEELDKKKKFLKTILDSQQQIIIITDGVSIKNVNRAFLEFYQIDSLEEFLKNYDCICDTFDNNSPDGFIKKINSGERWIDYIIKRPEENHKTVIKYGDREALFSVTGAVVDIGRKESYKLAVFTDITAIELERRQLQNILASIIYPILITSQKDRKILYANCEAQRIYRGSEQEIIDAGIDALYIDKSDRYKILNHRKKFGAVRNLEMKFKTLKGDIFDGLLSLMDMNYYDEPSYLGVVTDITEQKEREKELLESRKIIADSIQYASYIQNALLPDNRTLSDFFSDYFVIWEPRDRVGGDIYFFDRFQEDKLFIFLIDCTSHGVPGAFVTMVVKAVERHIIGELDGGKFLSPAEMLSIFNREIKSILNQYGENSISNVGFDGGVLLIDKGSRKAIYSGAETPLYYVQNGQVEMTKYDRHSIGYSSSVEDYSFREYVFSLEEVKNFYLTTDGYYDQVGGEKRLMFGKKRLKKELQRVQKKSMEQQRESLLSTLREYQGDENRRDDITFIGLEVE